MHKQMYTCNRYRPRQYTSNDKMITDDELSGADKNGCYDSLGRNYRLNNKYELDKSNELYKNEDLKNFSGQMLPSPQVQSMPASSKSTLSNSTLSNSSSYTSMPLRPDKKFDHRYMTRYRTREEAKNIEDELFSIAVMESEHCEKLKKERNNKEECGTEKINQTAKKILTDVNTLMMVTTRDTLLDVLIESLVDVEIKNADIKCVDIKYVNSLKMNDHTSQMDIDKSDSKREEKSSRNTQKHIYFIVGRGKVYPDGHMNIPLNPDLKHMNIVYVDPNPIVKADIGSMLNEVDFRNFDICYDQDPKCDIDVKIIFDWSSFYCGALQSLTTTVKKIRRRCQIFVPLTSNENKIPGDITQQLKDPIFDINLVEGKYPLFDWSDKIKLNNSIFPSKQKISDFVNPSRYIRIDGYP